METGRRSFVSIVIATFTGTAVLCAAQQGRTPGMPRMPRIPDASGSRPVDDPDVTPRRDPKGQLKENQKNLRLDTDRLLQLAQELKTEVDKTEETDVLSLPLIHKAEEIEKLAKQIKSLARAA
jgi:hypothetical protein